MKVVSPITLWQIIWITLSCIAAGGIAHLFVAGPFAPPEEEEMTIGPYQE